MSEFGFAALGWLVAIAAVLAGLAAYLLRFRPTWRAASLQAAPQSEPKMGRLSVLESTGIEGGRQLLLVRCDDIEHLIMVGGPADLVVENDVRRGRAAPLAQPLGPRPAAVTAPERTAAVEHREGEPARAVSEAKAPEPRRSDRPMESRERPAAPSRPVLAAVPAPHAPVEARQGHPPAAPLRAASPAAQPAAPAKTGATGEAVRRHEPAVAPRQAAPVKPAELSEMRAKAKSAAAEAPFGRREAPSAPVAPPRREPGAAPSIAAVRHEEPARVPPAVLREPAPEDRHKKPNGSAAGNGHDVRRPSLPTAEVPWPETDTIENEIVRAFRSDRPAQPAADKPAQGEAVPAKPATDPATTLGDLAERLEEALAREVQLANKGRGTLDLDLDAFAFDAPATPQAPPVDVKPQPVSQAPVKAELKAVLRAAAKPHQAAEAEAKAVKPPNAEKPASAAPSLEAKAEPQPVASPAAAAPKVEAKAAPTPPDVAAAPAAPPPVAEREPEIVRISAPAETVQAEPAPQPAAPEPQARPELTAAPEAKAEAELAIAPEPLVSVEPIAAPPPAAAPEAAAAPPAALAPAPAGAPPPAALAAPEPQARPELSAQEPADGDARPLAPAPQAESRREGRAAAAERQEEAPVISLTARRRDISDPLEDEMARLLGELSGDTRR